MEEEQKLIAQQAGLNINSVEKGSSTAGKLELTVDEVIEGYIGSFGLSQILHVFLVSFALTFDSQNTLATIFSDAQPSSWRCKTGSLCEGDQSSPASVCGLAPGTWEWVGGKTSSTIAEWSLICDRKFLAAIPASLYFLGSLLGSACFGRLADKRLGRKKTILLSCLLSSATSLLTSLSPNIWIYTLLRFANGFSRAGIGICCLVLSTEAVGRKWRGQVGQYGFFCFTAGFLSLPVIAYSTRTCWRTLYKILSLFPLVYCIVCLPLVSESPRWLLVMGRSKEALDVLKNFARHNGKKLPANLILANSSYSGNKTGCEESAERSAADANESMWTTKWAAQRMILVMITGFGVGFVYYGIQLNVENLNFDLYFSVGFNALMEIPAVIIGTVLLSFTNRRFLFSESAFLAGVSCILCIFFSNNGAQNQTKEAKSSKSWPQLTMEAIGFMAASICYDILYIYCVELFPTNVRNFAVSFLRQALMFGASVSPLLVVLGRLSPSLSFLIFGGFAIFSGILSLWLPETKDAPLCETLKMQQEEEEKQRRKLSGENQVFELGNCESDDNLEKL